MSGFLSTIASLAKIGIVLAVLGLVFVVSGYLGVQYSLSGEELDVPDVVGMDLEAATAALAQNGLIVEIDERPATHDTIPAGAVLRQNPFAGTAIKRQRGIRLTMSSGPPPRALPMTVGTAVQEATIALQQKEVAVDYIARVYSSEFGRDRVIGQQPNTTELPEGVSVPVRLLVSLGPEPERYVMPDLTYRTLDSGLIERLEAMGFQVQRRLSGATVAGRSSDTIIRHDPSPGYPIRQGDIIRLYVNQ